MKGKGNSQNPVQHVFSNPIKMKFFPMVQSGTSLSQQTFSPQLIQKFHNLLQWRKNQGKEVDTSIESL